MTLMSRAVGTAVAEWHEEEPLRWVLREKRGEGKHATVLVTPFDLRPIQSGYSSAFLHALRDSLIDRRLRNSHRTCKTLGYNVRRLLQICQEAFEQTCAEQGIACTKFERIDGDFLVGLSAIKDKVSPAYRVSLTHLYAEERENTALFAADLRSGDFPDGHQQRDGKLRKNVVATALSRAALVEVLNATEAAFEAGELDLSRYAFSRILLSRTARPETYKSLRCKDLMIDQRAGVKSYFLSLEIPKARTSERPVATVSIHPEVGRLLEKQREAVADRLTHLLDEKNSESTGLDSNKFTVGDLALFPSPAAHFAGERVNRLGMMRESGQFAAVYVEPLRRAANKHFTCTAMRHTMGTQLAMAGCSSHTIAAVLLHATSETAKVYVDLVFEGVIDELSDSMEPAFMEHFPVYKEFVSAKTPIAPEKRIVSRSPDRSRRETTGECGRDQICEQAPLTCYDCYRFKPAYDVDHTINLDRVNEEIGKVQDAGLQWQSDVRRWKHLGNRIRVVIQVCELKRAALELERSRSGGLV